MKFRLLYLHTQNTIWLVQPKNLLIIQIAKCLVDLTKYVVDSTKLFCRFNGGEGGGGVLLFKFKKEPFSIIYLKETANVF